jgi:signal transduction histidine kinase
MLETRQSPAAATVHDIADRLRRNRAPAIVVAPAESRLVAANPAGARAFGLAVSAGTPADTSLDSAMPAIVQLRRLAGLYGAEHQGVVEPLVFWTPGGAARVLCRVRTLDDASGRHLLLIEPLDHTQTSADVIDRDDGLAEEPADEVDGAEPIATTAAASRDGDGDGDGGLADAGDAAEPPPVRNDADILKAIARQILGERAIAPAQAIDIALPSAIEGSDAVARAKRSGPARRAAPARDRARKRDIIDLDDDAPPMQKPAVASGAEPGATDPGGSGASGGDNPGGSSGDGDDDSRAAGSKPLAVAAADAITSAEERPHEDATAGTSATAADDATAPAKPRAGRTRSALVRRIAHELKSPLSAIAAAAEIMKDERFGPIGDERYLRYARDIHESARHALDVVQRMLGAQVESDGAAATELEFTDLDVNAVLAALVSTMQPLAAEAGVTLSTALSAPLPRVVADGTSMRQMVLNLVTNALKFTPRGGDIVVSTHAEIDGPLTLAITDTGPGLGAEDVARFEATGAAGEMAPRKGGGLGIGLPLVRSLAHANGAEFSVSNRNGGGVSATIVFPKSRQVLV